MIRTILILLVAALLGWGGGQILREASSTAHNATAHNTTTSVEAAAVSVQQRLQSQVVLYTLADCDYSKAAKAFFDAQGIDYVELDVGTSMQARAEARSLGATKVPFMLVGDARIDGFDEPRLLSHYGLPDLSRPVSENGLRL